MSAPQPFDEYARDYDRALNRGLRWTGDDRDYFARTRVGATVELAAALGLAVRDLCDFGCGTGETLPLLAEAFNPRRLVGFDTSLESLATARDKPGMEDCTLLSRFDGTRDAASMDLVYCNGVFHHIPPADRDAAVASIHSVLRPGGLWFLWENNPWNPGTRWVMSRIEFDRDAVLISPREAARIGIRGGFLHIATRHLFFFPGWLKRLRPLERLFHAVPVGGQFVSVLQKPRTLSAITRP